MSAPVRFLAVAVLAWAGVRAATLGVVPGAELFETAAATPATAPSAIIPTVFPPLEPVPPVPAAYPAVASAPISAPQVRYVTLAYPHSPVRPTPAAASPLLPEPEPLFYAPIPQLDEWPLSRLASGSRNSSSLPNAGRPLSRPFDRVQLTAWALVRGQGGGDALASGGTLGGSQAGARLTYALDPRLALSVRSSAPIGSSSGGKIAAGIRLTPLKAIPVALTAERRQAIGSGGGRSAFALFLEGGVYQRPLPWQFSLDAYAQAGVVGARRRDLFADGGLSIMRPVHGPLSAGVGVWGGAQPGLYRVDAGPRLSLRVRRNMRIHLDWRQRLAGKAEPGSGPAVTLAGDF